MNSYEIKSSTELMQNYVPSEVMAPEKQIRAVESSAGTAILFSIDTEGFLRVTAETPGDRHGWQRFNLSSKTHPDEFSKGDAECISFDVARCADGTIRMAMVLKDKNTDKADTALYLASTKPGNETAWFNSPAWVRYKYDDPDNKRSPVKIVNVFLSEATDGDYTVVDVSDASDSSNIFRYYIDVAHKPGDPAWKPHDLDIQFQADKYSSCLGRKAGKEVDGIYTSGHEGDNPQILYKPLHGSKRERASAVYLQLPGNLKPDAIAACRGENNSSDLYVAAAGGLYYFASNKQHEDETGFEIMSGDKRLNNVKSLFAAVADQTVMVWGLNGNMEFFYTTCPLDQITTKPSAWSIPLPIMSGVQQVTPFLNRTNSANTYFAHTTGNHLRIAVKAAGKKGTWSLRDVHLPPPEKTKKPAKSFTSYTTHLQVRGPDGQPTGGKTVSIKAPNGVTSVYINHLYYVVGPEPIKVATDAAGNVTIVEAISRLDGTQFNVSVDGDAVTKPCTINPMADSRWANAQLETLKTEADLNGAFIYYQKKGASPKKLVTEGAGSTDVRNAAKNIKNLFKTKDDLPVRRNASNSALLSSTERSPEYKGFIKDGIPRVVDGGDLLSMLESKHAHHLATAQAQGGASARGESLWDAIVDFFEGLWNFVVRIGEEIFTFIIETIEEVYAVIKYVFTKVVDTLNDILDYLKYLFEPDDIRRTKDVMKNLILRLLQDQVDGIQVIKEDVDRKIRECLTQIDDWAGLDWAKQLGEDGKATPQSKMAPPPDPSATDSLLAYHLQANVDDSAPAGSDNLPAYPSTSLDDLWAKVNKIMDTLGEAKDQVEKLAREAPTLPLADIFKRLVGILAHAGLETAGTMFDALLEVLYKLAVAGLNMLDSPIYIPVITDILDLFGVERFSLLDALCWVGAIPVTSILKAATGKPPFPEGPETTFLIEADSFKKVLSHFSDGGKAAMDSSNSAFTANYTAPKINQNNVAPFLACHGFACACGALYTVIGALDAAKPDTGVDPGIGAASWLLSLGAATGQFAGSFFFPYPTHGISNESVYNRAIAGIRFGCMVAFNPIGGFFISKGFPGDKLIGPVYRKLGAALDAVLACFAAVGTAENMVNLVKRPASDAKDLALMEEASNCLAYLGRCSRSVAIMIPEETTKIVLSVVMGICFAGYSVAQLAECALVSTLKLEPSVNAAV